MRFQQITAAAITRATQNAGVREMFCVDTFARVMGLDLCMACVSPGMHLYSGSHAGSPGYPDSPSPSQWATGEKGWKGKRERLPLATRLGRLVLSGIADLRLRNS